MEGDSHAQVILSVRQLEVLTELARDGSQRTVEVEFYHDADKRSVLAHIDRYDYGARAYVVDREGEHTLV